ncbi:MAG: tRNA (adenosine(37)-N6)-threonylcarbamoyltransferase complex ATPase subunit type 1 TsaE [Flavobacteriaceae bacterium]|nr:tRNA (adenosine(37)-N6)-threonylcarbamoyltransferase complex ATPase subunit type 1 TsaE [Flavobacteriaceae bacterium]
MDYTFTLQDLPKIASTILLEAQNKVLLFYGDMGVGKTTLIKEITKQLGVNETISSPTFALVNEYEIKDDKVYHFDFYRINNEEEALDIGIEEYFYSDHWNLIEWPEKIKSLLPKESTKLILTNNQNGSRTLKIMPVK